MIRREHGRDWLLISQIDHARLAGALAEAWNFTGTRFAALRDDLVQAVRQHDEGWAAWEQLPAVDPESGRPRDFTEMPMPEATGIWGRSIAFCLEHHAPPSTGPLLYCYREWLGSRKMRLTNERVRAIEAVCRQTRPFTAESLIDELRDSHGRVSRGLVSRELGRLRTFGVLEPCAQAGGEAYARACPLDRLSEVGGLWVSRHFQALAERAWDNRTARNERLAIDSFLDEQLRIHSHWRSSLPREFPPKVADELIDRGFRWVQFFDRLSLWLCSARRVDPAEFEVPGGGTLRLRPTAPDRIEFEPQRFLNGPLTLRVMGLRLPARPYQDDGELRTALTDAPRQPLAWQLIPS
ncbi:MAG TPA: DUF3891 family protein [Planctomycetaceae bacterium]|nr:DUF3891 family protein [Planctomycetaceae bacterium]